MTFSLHISSYITKSAGPGLISIFCKDKPARNIMIKSCQGLTVCCIYCESRQCILHTPKTQTLIAKVNFKQCTARSMQNKKKESLKSNFSIVLPDPLCYGVPPSNQVRVVAVSLPQLTQASFLQKNQKLQNHFLISVTLRWHKVSVACKNQSFKR